MRTIHKRPHPVTPVQPSHTTNVQQEMHMQDGTHVKPLDKKPKRILTMHEAIANFDPSSWNVRQMEQMQSIDWDNLSPEYQEELFQRIRQQREIDMDSILHGGKKKKVNEGK
jgi:hypothetical protein